ncbi:hypothetical protein AB6A40_000251 [Gnathostoma spinigerum]|uniref:NAD(+) ADP-ribosyltransferase n=1 Tax=Gnathostoma spinigerum TaxID=75299 RepID=A0ABD6E3T2_9BILA
MSTVRSVRFSHKAPEVSPDAPFCGEQQTSITVAASLPKVFDDALYCQYDMYTAASVGDAEIVETQLRSGFDPNRLNGSGWSALMYAAYLGHDCVSSLLLQYGASTDLTNENGQTALMLAAACGNLSNVRLLLKRGADVDLIDRNGQTALFAATACSQTSCVEALLEMGADPNMVDNHGMTPTLVACSVGHELTLLTLLQNMGDPNVKNENGEDGEALAADNQKTLSILRDPSACRTQLRSKKSVVAAREVESLDDLLNKLKLEKYKEVFMKENIDLTLFLRLTDVELSEMGIKAFGPRKKMLNAIQRYQRDGTFLTDSDFDMRKKEWPAKEHSERSQQVTYELMECQQELAKCQQDLRKARKIMTEQQIALEAAMEAGRESRKIAFAMLQEIRQNETLPSMEKEVLTIIQNIDRIAMRMMELPRI